MINYYALQVAEMEPQMAGNLMKIGICGGTFNPIHCGHLAIAHEVRINFNLEKIIFIPTGKPPHKDLEVVADSFHRLRMVSLAVEEYAFFEVSDIEVLREGYTYTIDTLTELKGFYGNGVRIFYIIGFDVLMSLETWKSLHHVAKMCEFIAVIRTGINDDDISNKIAYLREKFEVVVHLTNIQAVEISSTEIRQKLKDGISIKNIVPEIVEEYIKENNIYRENKYHA